jgi:hypothetical protein
MDYELLLSQSTAEERLTMKFMERMKEMTGRAVLPRAF